MNAHMLDAHGVILNTIVVDSLDILPGLVDASIGGSAGDSVVNGVLVRLPVPVVAPAIPQSVTRRQARQALLLRGKLAMVQPAINAEPDATRRAMAQIEWDDSLEFLRTRPLVIQIGAAIGLDAAGLDELFTFAATL